MKIYSKPIGPGPFRWYDGFITVWTLGFYIRCFMHRGDFNTRYFLDPGAKIRDEIMLGLTRALKKIKRDEEVLAP